MSNRDLKLRAQYKQKEFDRLKDYFLNQMSEIEVGLNPSSTSRGPYASNIIIWAPSEKEIDKLHLSLHELRSNILTSEEQETLNEKG